MKMFGNLQTDGLEETGDRLGGGGVLESGIYTGKIKAVYAGKASASPAQSVTMLIDIGGREYRETVWITSKEGKNFYPDKNDKTKKIPLPGFTIADDLCLVTTGMPLSEQTGEEKVLSIYDFEAKREVPTNVPVLTELTGKEVTLAIVKETVDKQAKDSTGVYKNTGETRDQNVIDKVFHAESGRTVTEIKSGFEEPVFLGKWKEKNTGVTRNRAKGAEGNAGVPGQKPSGLFGGNAAGNQSEPAKKKSIFG